MVYVDHAIDPFWIVCQSLADTLTLSSAPLEGRAVGGTLLASTPILSERCVDLDPFIMNVTVNPVFNSLQSLALPMAHVSYSQMMISVKPVSWRATKLMYMRHDYLALEAKLYDKLI